jgi:hypothetical protein
MKRKVKKMVSVSVSEETKSKSEIPTFEYNGEDYVCHLDPHQWIFPTITGFTKIRWESARFSYDSQLRPKLHVTKRRCRLFKAIKPKKHMGQPQIIIVGGYGSGKSNLLNEITAFQLAKGYKGIMFVDRFLECRHLGAHGFWKRSGGKVQWDKFFPFTLDIAVPKDYEFHSTSDNPYLWEVRSNINLLEFETSKDILKALKPHHLVAVYEEAFSDRGKLQLFVDLMHKASFLDNRTSPLLFAHHELSTLIPMLPNSEQAKLAQRASDIALKFRKADIMLLASFHMLSEVYYRISQKTGYICQTEPVNRKSMEPWEDDARKLKLGQFNLVHNGWWCTHKFPEFTEVIDDYRLIPNEEPFDSDTSGQNNSNPDIRKLAWILSYKADLTQREIGRLLGRHRTTIGEYIKEFEELKEN